MPSNTWVATGDLTQARAGAASTLLYDGHVLVTGGLDGSGAATASVERYAPDGGAFLSTPAMSTPRANHTSSLLPDGRVLVAGGVDASGQALASAETYDPTTNSWTPASPLNVARQGHTATALYDGRIVIAGGDAASAAIASIEIFDLYNNGGTFTLSGSSLTSPRIGHAAALTYDDFVVIAGGFDGTNPLASIDIYDPNVDTVTAAASMSAARAGLSATTLLDGKILLAGGAGTMSELATAEVFDPAGNTIGLTANTMVATRQRHQAILLPHNNQVLIAGGTAGGNAVATAEVFVEWQGNGGAFYPANPPTNSDGTQRAPGTARAWATAATTEFSRGSDHSNWTERRADAADGRQRSGKWKRSFYKQRVVRVRNGYHRSGGLRARKHRNDCRRRLGSRRDGCADAGRTPLARHAHIAACRRGRFWSNC